MVAKYLLLELQADHPRVVIVTDRKELDKQITATFAHTRLRPAHATNGGICWDWLRMSGWTSSPASSTNSALPSDWTVATNLGTLLFLWTKATAPITAKCHIKLRTVFPNACYIGFYRNALDEEREEHLEKGLAD